MSEKQTKFYEYRQNNSGGSLDIDEGVSIRVLVEAYSVRQANILAQKAGVYFGGYGDCPCCGDCWYEADEEDGYIYPHHYGDPLDECYESTFARGRPSTTIHYLDGRVQRPSLKPYAPGRWTIQVDYPATLAEHQAARTRVLAWLNDQVTSGDKPTG